MRSVDSPHVGHAAAVVRAAPHFGQLGGQLDESLDAVVADISRDPTAPAAAARA